MFKKTPEPKAKIPNDLPSATELSEPKYKHPKILLIDTAPEIATTLEKEGYNVSIGTFGKPYKVQKDSGYRPVVVKASLPNYTEQEIIVIDLVADDPETGPPGQKMAAMGEPDWWAKCNYGEIGSRVRAMAMVQDDFDRILNNGGAFVVFSDARDKREFVLARHYDDYRGFSVEREILFDNWSFLSVLSNLIVTGDHGEEIDAVKHDWSLVRLLGDYLEGASFFCTFEAQWHIEKRWAVLAKNKYGEAVAGVMVPSEKTKAGWIIILPRIKQKDRFLAGLLKNVLPDLCPGLFPHAEGQKWVHRPEYELPSVLEKAAQISVIQDEAAERVEALEKAIEEDRIANHFLYDLIRETGTPLVEAVKRLLALLGFRSVVDVDEEMERAGKDASLREDLRIHDNSPVLVVDIKGVAGKPADAEALQAQKHAFVYIQEQNRPDVRGLTIINHQRLLPPLERDNDMPFRKEILDNAAQMKLGLMTGWDLYRLMRGFSRNEWEQEWVIPIFYRTGRIHPVPEHYEFVGTVKQVWKPAFSIELVNSAIRLGERLALEFPVDFEEQIISSIHLNDTSVETASAACEVGIQRDESLPKVKLGMAVYRVTGA